MLSNIPPWLYTRLQPYTPWLCMPCMCRYTPQCKVHKSTQEKIRPSHTLCHLRQSQERQAVLLDSEAFRNSLQTEFEIHLKRVNSLWSLSFVIKECKAKLNDLKYVNVGLQTLILIFLLALKLSHRPSNYTGIFSILKTATKKRRASAGKHCYAVLDKSIPKHKTHAYYISTVPSLSHG